VTDLYIPEVSRAADVMIGAFALNDASRFPRYALRYVTLETIAPLSHDPQVGLAALAAR